MLASRGRLSVLLIMPISIAFCSRKRYSIDWDFSSLCRPLAFHWHRKGQSAWAYFLAMFAVWSAQVVAEVHLTTLVACIHLSLGQVRFGINSAARVAAARQVEAANGRTGRTKYLSLVITSSSRFFQSKRRPLRKRRDGIQRDGAGDGARGSDSQSGDKHGPGARLD